MCGISGSKGSILELDRFQASLQLTLSNGLPLPVPKRTQESAHKRFRRSRWRHADLFPGQRDWAALGGLPRTRTGCSGLRLFRVSGLGFRISGGLRV